MAEGSDPEFIQADLLRRLKANDGEAFETLVRVYGPRLLSVTRRFCGGNDADAQDALQDAFVSVFKSLKTFQGDSQLPTWLHTIAVRSALQRIRRKKRRAASEQPIDELLPKYLADGHRAAPGLEWSAGEADAQRRETRELVRRCILRLPETYRTVMLLRDIEEFDTAETARLLGVSQNVVKVRLHRARQALRELLDPHMHPGGGTWDA